MGIKVFQYIFDINIYIYISPSNTKLYSLELQGSSIRLRHFLRVGTGVLSGLFCLETLSNNHATLSNNKGGIYIYM